MYKEIPHYFRIDKPFRTLSGRGSRISRVQTFGGNQQNGNNEVHWLKVLVDAGARDVFAYQPRIVPANGVAIPAP
jgi:hypothetical protein